MSNTFMSTAIPKGDNTTYKDNLKSTYQRDISESRERVKETIEQVKRRLKPVDRKCPKVKINLLETRPTDRHYKEFHG